MIATLVPGALLLLSGTVVVYALRGPWIELPRSPLGIVLALLAAVVLGQLARLAALALAWAVGQVSESDLFQDQAALELVDELSPRRLAPEVAESVARALHDTGVELPRIARLDDDATRDTKERSLESVFELARARAAAKAPAHLETLEARVDGARALCAALLISSVSVLVTAAHDVLFVVAHAISSFTLVVLGLGLAFATLAAIGWARAQSRRLARFVFLVLPGSLQDRLNEVGKEARLADAQGPSASPARG
ncbi:MAG TPA: hypothetical protein VFF73_21265 [Planctomycetota bacterium]|nr:hypothetical protein [Planctomycetota bacterium]